MVAGRRREHGARSVSVSEMGVLGREGWGLDTKLVPIAVRKK